MISTDSHLILPFESSEATLEIVGGKGTNLARLTRAGFHVPYGFILSTQSYHNFVAENGLGVAVQGALDNLSAENIDELEKASTRIRAAFSAGKMSPVLKTDILRAFEQFNGVPVAVRSSATSEDLPDLSFAGQQDTYLNIVGGEHLLTAIINCWSSLWTARAIGYRLRNNLNEADIALAVIVQEMVQSEISGVMFTANPLTGLLSETVMDATFGLGEVLVSGQVEPDHFVVNSLDGGITSQKLGDKKISTRSLPDGGVEIVAENGGAHRTLTDDQVRELVKTGQEIQKEYGTPQDIEWALADGRLFILQSRAITSLFPLPKVSFDPLVVWFSFGTVQGLVGPMTPLGQEVIRRVSLGGYKMFHVKMDFKKADLFVPAGERIWIRISDMLRNPLGSRVFGGFLNFIEPSVGQILMSLGRDPRLGLGKGKLKFSTLRRMAGFFLPVVVNFIRTLINPVKGRIRFDSAIEDYLLKLQISPAEDRFGRLANFTAFMLQPGGVIGALPFLLPRFLPIFAPCMAGLNFLNHVCGNETLIQEVTRALPHNVTTEMDLALWETATQIRTDKEAENMFNSLEASMLAARFLESTLPPAAQNSMTRFMQKYGMRGIGEIDFGQPRWREDPTPIIHNLKSYLQIDPAFAPDIQFAKGEKTANNAIEELAAIVRKQKGGWLKEKRVRAATRRIRLLMGARESPKFFAIRAMGIARSYMLETGKQFADAGMIIRADDLSFLNIAEMEALARNEPRDWKALVQSRRDAYQHELRRRQVPRVLVSDGRAFYEGVGAESDTKDSITGSPVSPGMAEGIVHVVLDPRGVQLTPGEILVCPGTDPAWTPLFMSAGGLITEVGGMMTHGSVVAREYGIPAVVGVHEATLRLKSGQRIRLNGTNGKIVVI